MPQTTTLIATARNEGPFLLEWVAYHRAIGFDHIVVLSDPSEDGTEALLDRLASTGGITHIPHHAQTGTGATSFTHRAYAHAQTLPQVQHADWVLALDIDEYLNIHVGAGRLDDLFAAVDKCGDCDVLALGWRIFGNAGQAGYINRLLLPRLTRAAPETPVIDKRHLAIKSLFRPAGLTQVAPHRPTFTPATAPKIWRNGAGQDVTRVLGAEGTALTPATRGHTLAQINHYPVRGNAVFALHHLHEPPLTGDAQPMTLADHAVFNCNHVVANTITRWAQATTAEIKRLQAFPGVQAAHKKAVKSFESLIATYEADLTAQGDTTITGLLRPEAAKTTMAQQVANADRLHAAPDTATAMQMVAPSDMAPAWLTDLRETRHKRGWYVADDHFAVHMTTRDPQTLILSFDSSAEVKDRTLSRSPWGYGLCKGEGWSHMGVMAFNANWYRDARLMNFLAGQVKGGVFAKFDTVILTGAEMGGYGACAFASLIPDCTVVAFAPQSSLAPDLVPWEHRFASGRAADWTGQHRDAAADSQAAKQVYLIYDPYQADDRSHATRFRGENVTHLHSWYAPPLIAGRLHKTAFVGQTLRAAVAGTLAPQTFYPLYRSRRDQPWYASGMADHVIAKGGGRRATQLADILRIRTDSALQNRL